jgi:uncharacterized membrane protein YqjE
MNVDDALLWQRKAQVAYDAAEDDLASVKTKRLAGFTLAAVAVALVVATGLLAWIGVAGLACAAAVLAVAATICASLVLAAVYGRSTIEESRDNRSVFGRTVTQFAPPALESARRITRTAKADLAEANEAVARSTP